MRAQRLIPVAAVVATSAGLVASFAAPPDRVQGDLQRLMYVHVPAAWLAYAAFLVTFISSAGWLWRHSPRLDRLAAASAEVGVFFAGLTIVLGSIWGKAAWGVWWTWDARLVTTALLFFVYLGYLALRRAIDDGTDRARRAAVFGVIAFVLVPVVHFSVLWWRTLHQPPTVLRPGDPTMDHRMLAALLIDVAAFSLLGTWLLLQRLRLGAEREALEASMAAGDRALAGSSVQPPQLEGQSTNA